MKKAVMCAFRIVLLLVLATSTIASAQTTAQADYPEIPTVSISFGTEVKVPNLSGVVGMAQQKFCSNDGRIFLRPTDGKTYDSIVSITPEGIANSFLMTSMPGIPGAMLVGYFPTDDALFALVRRFMYDAGTGNATRIGPCGKSVPVSGRVATGEETYVAKFTLDGRYQGAVNLELPFRPFQIGVFPSGNFVIAGADRSGEPKMALVQSNGQFQRYLELEDDITTNSDIVKDQVRSGDRGNLSGVMLWMAATAQLLPDREKLLFVRTGQKDLTVFEISPSGQVKRAAIKGIEKDTTVNALVPVDGRWLVQFTKRRPDGPGLTFSNYFVNPDAGIISQKVVYNTHIGLGLACYHDGEYLAVRAGNREFTLLKGKPDATPTAPRPPDAQ